MTNGYKRILNSRTSLGGFGLVALTAFGAAVMPSPSNAQSQKVTVSQSVDTVEAAQAAAGSAVLPNTVYRFDIDAQPLATALVAFSRISGIDVVLDGRLPEGAQSIAVQGQQTASDALDRLLSQSGLDWAAMGPTTIRVIDPVSSVTGDAPTLTAPVRVTATTRALGPNGTPDGVFETPGSVAVITRESMRKSPVREAREIFNNVAGVDISNDARDPGLTVNVRGQQEMGRVNVNIDGARQNYNQLTHGTTSRVYIDPALLAEVEIEKSNLTQNGGAGASAGIVTMRTLNTQDILDDGEDWGGKVNISHGTNSYDFGGDVSAGYRVSPKLDVAAAISRKVVGNYRAGAHNPGLFTSGIGKFYSTENSRPKYTFLRQTSGLLKANVYLNDDQELNLGYVGSMSDYAKTNDVNNIYTDFNETETHTLTAKHNWNPGSDLINLNSSLYWTRTENHQFRPARFSASGAVTTDSFDNHYTLDTTGADISNRSDIAFDKIGDGLSSISFDYGSELFHDRAKTTADMGGQGGYGASYQVEGSTPSGERDVYGGYVNATYGWNDMFSLTGGLRYDRYDLNGDAFWCETVAASGNLCSDGGTPLDIDLSESKVSPSFGASISPIEGVQFFANYRENMRAPTIQEAMLSGDHIGNVGIPFYSNANLKAEESETKEIGVNFKFDNVLQKGDGFRAKVAYFRSKIENYTTIAYVPQPTTEVAIPRLLIESKMAAAMVNLTDPVYVNGTEMELSYDAGEYYLGGTLTLSDMDLQGDYNPFVLDADYDQYANTGLSPLGVGDPIYGGSNQLYGIYATPKRKYTLDGGVRLFDQDLVAGMRATFVYPQDNFGSSSSSSIVGQYFKYRIFDFYSSYEINENVTVRFAVNNMFDEGYVQGTGGTYAPSPGRTAVITLSGNF
ncbi:TonB-dependent receptor [Thalassospira lucentensis]|nr:TonB-dependent receptor [Thalassospira lucentensis]